MKIFIDEMLCKGCAICVNVCPKKVFDISAQISTGYNISSPTRPQNCIACRLCEMSCPDFAIEVLDEETCDEKWAEKAITEGSG
jgi:2-oxoglutarate ferredoxin oxidoreductase subunit delta